MSVDRHPWLWRYVGLTGGVLIGFLARTAGRTWAGCCSGRTVRNSESLRGLRCTVQERRVRGKARALLGPLAVRTYRTGTKALPCQSRADNGYGYVRAKAVRTSGRERRLCRVKAVRASGQERRLCRVKAELTSEQAMRPRLRWALS